MSSLRGAEDLAEFIIQNYSGRIVEVGAGHVPAVALLLLARGLEVVLTDREERLLGNLQVEKDDIFAPRMELYREASLLYSIRPPLELQIAMGERGRAGGSGHSDSAPAGRGGRAARICEKAGQCRGSQVLPVQR